MKLAKSLWTVGLMALSLGAAFAQESVIRKNLAERLPAFSKIDEVSKTPMNGLYEIRVNDKIGRASCRERVLASV